MFTKAIKLENKQKADLEARLYKKNKLSIEAYIEPLGASLEAVENHRKIIHDNF